MSGHEGGISKPLNRSKPKRPKRLGVKAIEIDKAENGYTTRTRYDTADEPGTSYDPGDTHVHGSKQAMTDFITNVLTGAPDDAKDRRKKAAKSMMSSDDAPYDAKG